MVNSDILVFHTLYLYLETEELRSLNKYVLRLFFTVLCISTKFFRVFKLVIKKAVKKARRYYVSFLGAIKEICEIFICQLKGKIWFSFKLLLQTFLELLLLLF